MAVPVDPKCRELAELFLGALANVTEKDILNCAQALQDVCDNYAEDIKLREDVRI